MLGYKGIKSPRKASLRQIGFSNNQGLFAHIVIILLLLKILFIKCGCPEFSVSHAIK